MKNTTLGIIPTIICSICSILLFALSTDKFIVIYALSSISILIAAIMYIFVNNHQKRLATGNIIFSVMVMIVTYAVKLGSNDPAAGDGRLSIQPLLFLSKVLMGLYAFLALCDIVLLILKALGKVPKEKPFLIEELMIYIKKFFSQRR